MQKYEYGSVIIELVYRSEGNNCFPAFVSSETGRFSYIVTKFYEHGGFQKFAFVPHFDAPAIPAISVECRPPKALSVFS
jgi:hypothetical protein